MLPVLAPEARPRLAACKRRPPSIYIPGCATTASAEPIIGERGPSVVGAGVASRGCEQVEGGLDTSWADRFTNDDIANMVSDVGRIHSLGRRCGCPRTPTSSTTSVGEGGVAGVERIRT